MRICPTLKTRANVARIWLLCFFSGKAEVYFELLLRLEKIGKMNILSNSNIRKITAIFLAALSVCEGEDTSVRKAITI